jgi:hypothetical protein
LLSEEETAMRRALTCLLLLVTLSTASLMPTTAIAFADHWCSDC